MTLRPKPVQQPIDVWLGGQAPSELRRVGRLGDGWLPSFCTRRRRRATAGRSSRDRRRARPRDRPRAPRRAGRLQPHRGARRGRGAVATRRPDLDPADVVPVGLDALRGGSRRYRGGPRSSSSCRSTSRPTGTTSSSHRRRPPAPPDLTQPLLTSPAFSTQEHPHQGEIASRSGRQAPPPFSTHGRPHKGGYCVENEGVRRHHRSRRTGVPTRAAIASRTRGLAAKFDAAASAGRLSRRERKDGPNRLEARASPAGQHCARTGGSGATF